MKKNRYSKQNFSEFKNPAQLHAGFQCIVEDYTLSMF